MRIGKFEIRSPIAPAQEVQTRQETESPANVFDSRNTFATFRRPSTNENRRAQALYSTNGWCRVLVKDTVGWVVGPRGCQVEFESDYIQGLWNSWRWSIENPTATIREMQALAMVLLLRDGDIFAYKQPQGYDDPKLTFIDGLDIYAAGNFTRTEYAGVLVNPETGQPEGYRYVPLLTALEPHANLFGMWNSTPTGRIIPAHQVIHVYDREYPTQYRGFTWLKSSLDSLEALDIFFEAIITSSQRAAEIAFLLEVPLEYMQRYVDNPAESDKSATALRLLDRVIEKEGKGISLIPPAVEVKNVPAPGTISQGIERVYRYLLGKAARGLGVSAYALTLDYDGTRYNASRAATDADREFYKETQNFLVTFLREVIENYWGVWLRMSNPRAAREWTPPVIRPSTFPHVDPFKDAQALRIGVDGGWLSPQMVIRLNGEDPARVKKDIEEWRRWESELPKTEERPTMSPSQEIIIDGE